MPASTTIVERGSGIFLQLRTLWEAAKSFCCRCYQFQTQLVSLSTAASVARSKSTFRCLIGSLNGMALLLVCMMYYFLASLACSRVVKLLIGYFLFFLRGMYCEM